MHIIKKEIVSFMHNFTKIIDLSNIQNGHWNTEKFITRLFSIYFFFVNYRAILKN